MMDIEELFANAKSVATLAEISKEKDALYLCRYTDNNNRYGDNRRIVELYLVRNRIGVIGGCFHFDVNDKYINVEYVELENYYGD